MSSFSKPRLAEAPCPDPCPDAVEALERRLTEYLPVDQVRQVRRAYEIGARAHEGQLRKSGEAYITHPVAVASLLANDSAQIREETLDLIQAYYQLGERPRRRLLDLAKSLHAEGDAA